MRVSVLLGGVPLEVSMGIGPAEFPLNVLAYQRFGVVVVRPGAIYPKSPVPI